MTNKLAEFKTKKTETRTDFRARFFFGNLNYLDVQYNNTEVVNNK